MTKSKNTKGIELRDKFASSALPSVIALHASRNETGKLDAEAIVIGAYSIADAMLLQRKRKSSTLSAPELEHILKNA